MSLNKKTETTLNRLNTVIKYLSEAKSPADIIENDKYYDVITELESILTNEEFIENNDDWNVLVKSEFEKLIVNCLDYYLEKCDSFTLSKYKYEKGRGVKDMNQNEKIINTFKCFLQVTHNLTQLQFSSRDLLTFNENLFNRNVLNTLLGFFKRDIFLKQYTNAYDFHYFIISIMKIINNISQNPYLDRQLWIDSNIEDVLRDFCSICRIDNLFHELQARIQHNLNVNIEKCIEKLKELREPILILANNQCYNDLLFMNRLVERPTFNKFILFQDPELEDIFKRLFEYFYEHRNELNYIKQNIELEQPCKYPSLNEKSISIFYYLVSMKCSILLNTLTKVTDLSDVVSKNDYLLDIYLKLFSDFKYIKNLVEVKRDKLFKMLNYSNGIIRALRDYYRKDFEELNIYQTLLELSKFLVKINKDNRCSKEINFCYWVLSYIATDKQMQDEPLFATLIKKIFNQIELLSYSNKVEFLSLKIPSLIDRLCRLAVNQKLKSYIFLEHIDKLRAVLFKGNDSEKIKLPYSTNSFNHFKRNIRRFGNG